MLLLMITAMAADSVVSLGRNVVIDAPPEAHAAERAAAWTSVLADCVEEAAPGAMSIVDRTDVLHSKGEARQVRELDPKAVVVTHPVPRDVDMEVWIGELEGVIHSLRADGGPAVLLVGAVAPTVAQVAVDAAQAEALQQQADARVEAWNERLAKLAEADDAVWMVDPWKSWPRDGKKRNRLTTEGWKLSDQAQARIGAIICDELIKRLARPQ